MYTAITNPDLKAKLDYSQRLLTEITILVDQIYRTREHIQTIDTSNTLALASLSGKGETK